jgi:hypothetical protein
MAPSLLEPFWKRWVYDVLYVDSMDYYIWFKLLIVMINFLSGQKKYAKTIQFFYANNTKWFFFSTTISIISQQHRANPRNFKTKWIDRWSYDLN